MLLKKAEIADTAMPMKPQTEFLVKFSRVSPASYQSKKMNGTKKKVRIGYESEQIVSSRIPKNFFIKDFFNSKK